MEYSMLTNEYMAERVELIDGLIHNLDSRLLLLTMCDSELARIDGIIAHHQAIIDAQRARAQGIREDMLRIPAIIEERELLACEQSVLRAARARKIPVSRSDIDCAAAALLKCKRDARGY